MGLREGGQIGWQAFGDRTGVGGDAQMALDAAGELADLAFQRVQGGMERADMAHQRPAGIGLLDAAGMAVEQVHAQARLQIGQALAGRGQGQVLALGATRDAARLGDGEHQVQRGQVKAHGGGLGFS